MLTDDALRKINTDFQRRMRESGAWKTADVTLGQLWESERLERKAGSGEYTPRKPDTDDSRIQSIYALIEKTCRELKQQCKSVNSDRVDKVVLEQQVLEMIAHFYQNFDAAMATESEHAGKVLITGPGSPPATPQVDPPRAAPPVFAGEFTVTCAPASPAGNDSPRASGVDDPEGLAQELEPQPPVPATRTDEHDAPTPAPGSVGAQVTQAAEELAAARRDLVQLRADMAQVVTAKADIQHRLAEAIATHTSTCEKWVAANATLCAERDAVTEERNGLDARLTQATAALETAGRDLTRLREEKEHAVTAEAGAKHRLEEALSAHTSACQAWEAECVALRQRLVRDDPEVLSARIREAMPWLQHHPRHAGLFTFADQLLALGAQVFADATAMDASGLEALERYVYTAPGAIGLFLCDNSDDPQILYDLYDYQRLVHVRLQGQQVLQLLVLVCLLQVPW